MPFPLFLCIYLSLTFIAAATQQLWIWHHLGISAVVLLSLPPFFCNSILFFSILLCSTVVLISVPPFFAGPPAHHYVDTSQEWLCQQHMGTQTHELFHLRNREKLPRDKNSFFSNLKKRRFFQIEKQITICCKLTGFSICLR